MPITKPFLAYTITDTAKLKYPVLCTPKLDGIRCVKVGGKALSRSFKPIPNRFIRDWIETNVPDGCDGEIMVGDNFQAVTSGVMSHDGEPEFTYVIFDYVTDLNRPYEERVKDMDNLPLLNHARILYPVYVKNEKELLEFESGCLSAGYEGIIVRSADGFYKCGRSTSKEGGMGKLKRFSDSEAEVIGFEELTINQNDQTRDALGYAERSTAKEGMVKGGTLGNLLVRDIHTKIEFSLGSGLNDAIRDQIWNNQESYIGQLVKYKYFAFGMKDKVRFPVFIGFRHTDDL